MLVEHATGHALFTLDTGGRVALWNAGAERILGWTEREAVGKPLVTFFSPEEADVPEREMALARARGHAEVEGWRYRRDGSRFWAVGTLVSLRDGTGVLQGYAKILRDETGARAAREALEAINADLEARVAAGVLQMHAYAEALASAEADARDRLAARLHDDLQQVLYGLRLGARALAADLAARGSSLDAAQAERLRVWADHALALTHDLTADLAGAADATLHDALALIARHTADTYGTAVTVRVAPERVEADRATRALVVQAVRELVFNAVKHAAPTAVAVHVGAAPGGGSEVVVTDNGAGFDPDTSTPGTGLTRVRARVEQAGGALDVESAPGAGTRARLWLPPTPFVGSGG